MTDNRYNSDMTPEERVLMAIVRVAERFKKDAASIFRQHGLTFPQYNVLRVLDASSEGRNTIKSVRRIMLVSSANMTGITKRLENCGFILRMQDPRDDRVKHMQITDKGRGALKSIADSHKVLEKRYLGPCSDEEKSGLLEALKEILRRTK